MPTESNDKDFSIEWTVKIFSAGDNKVTWGAAGNSSAGVGYFKFPEGTRHFDDIESAHAEARNVLEEFTKNERLIFTSARTYAL